MGKYYQHYKGNIYEYLGIAFHSETQEELTIYKSILNGKVWVRPVDMFFEYVTNENGEKVQRFTEIDIKEYLNIK